MEAYHICRFRQRRRDRPAIERKSPARAEGGPDAGAGEFAQLPRFDGPGLAARSARITLLTGLAPTTTARRRIGTRRCVS